MTATAVITVGYALAVALLAAGIWRVSRNIPKQPKTAPARPAPLAAVLDTEPGINLALHDECELLYTMPAYKDPGPDLAGLDRLRAALGEQHNQKGNS